MYYVLCTMYCVHTLYIVPMFLVLCTRYHVPCTMYIGTRYSYIVELLSTSTRYYVQGYMVQLYIVPCTYIIVRCTRSYSYYVRSWCDVLCTVYIVLCILVHDVCSKHTCAVCSVCCGCVSSLAFSRDSRFAMHAHAEIHTHDLWSAAVLPMYACFTIRSTE